MKVTEVIVKPILTEKASGLAQTKVYTFEVSVDASKRQIAETLIKLYNVKISSVRTLKHKGKIRRSGRSAKLRQMPDKKIALVSIKEGEINLFPQS